MKIRYGFVSNSSSTSFVLYGFNEPLSEFVDYLVAEKKAASKEEAYDDIYELLENLVDKTVLSFHVDVDGDEVYIGRDVPGDDDETFGQFKEKTDSDIRKVFGERDLLWIEESIYS
jgi:hypothetical protein